MKDKVVIFTQNNARILINPPDITKFEKKKNAFINPDLTFVTGIEPHFWRLLPGNKPLGLNEARRLKRELDDAINLTDSETHQITFYKTMREKLEEEIKTSERANSLISQLIGKANGIDPEEITSHLHDALISHSDNPLNKKESEAFRVMISKWQQGIIIPMDEEERVERQSDVKKGVVNALDSSVQSKNMDMVMSIAGVIVFIITVILLSRR